MGKIWDFLGHFEKNMGQLLDILKILSDISPNTTFNCPSWLEITSTVNILATSPPPPPPTKKNIDDLYLRFHSDIDI